MFAGFRFEVTLDNLLTFFGLVFVAWQMHDGNRQRKLESQIRLQDINRELVTLGFSKPELFDVLKDGKDVEPNVERYYLQLWLNQFCLFDALKLSSNFKKDVRESLETDFRDMISMKNMRRHWGNFGKFYPASFQKSVNRILTETGHKSANEKPEKVKRSGLGARFFQKWRAAFSRSLPQ